MAYKIVADSSANLQTLNNVDFASVPMRICTAETEFEDTPQCSVENMVSYLKKYKGKSSTACPGIGNWLEAFEGADQIFAVTITSGLSGSFAAASAAAEQYMEEHPDAKVFVIDSLSAGPELALIIEKLEELIGQGLSFEEICEKITGYQKRTHLVFCLASVINFARNGRISPALAKIVGVLDIRMVGKASGQGTLQLLHKCRGAKQSLLKIVNSMKDNGFQGGKVRIAHCFNLEGANKVKELLLELFPNLNVKIHECRALCSFYAEEGGILVGFEDLSPAL